METIQWLLSGDCVVQSLTYKYLLEVPYDHQNKGFIQDYCNQYDWSEHQWGHSIYSKKWVSSTYTLLELMYMEIDPFHPTYQDGTQRVIEELWKNHGMVSKSKHQDMCMASMVLSLGCYGMFEDVRIFEIVDYILEHQMEDGGWNCAWNSVHNKSTVGSMHTTLSVLESLWIYEKNGYHYRLDAIQTQVKLGHEYLLKRCLFKSLTTGAVIHPDMIACHYPYRWKYDCFRALEYFARRKYPYDRRMQPALAIVKHAISKGALNKGKQYAGAVHFKLEQGTKGRFNTFRSLFILKQYCPDLFKTFM